LALSLIERLAQAGCCRTLPMSALREKAVKAETVASVARKSAHAPSHKGRALFTACLPFSGATIQAWLLPRRSAMADNDSTSRRPSA